MHPARLEYEKRIKALAGLLRQFDQRGALLANARLVTFLGGLGLIIATGFHKLPAWGYGAGIGLIIAFSILASIHSRVIAQERRTQVRNSLNERGLKRLDGAWRQFSSTGEKYLSADHLYAPDLDLFGPASLFQKLDETGTQAGEERLAQWILNPSVSAAELKERQGAVAQLKEQVDFRQELIAETRVASSEKADPAKFLAWVEGPNGLAGTEWAFWLAHIFPPITFVVCSLAYEDIVPSIWGWACAGVQALVVALTAKPLGKMYDQLTLAESGFVRFAPTFRAIAQARFTHAGLKKLQAGIAEGTLPVPDRLARFERLLGFAELRHSTQFHAVLNWLLLWDLHWLHRLERWRQAHGQGARAWFEALAELEALSALATYAYETPDAVFPEVRDGPIHFDAQGLSHPLIEVPVANDFRFTAPGEVWVITGSNMSGKTTLLRTLGLAMVMARAGAPVRAKSLTCSQAQVLTSMRIKDSLERGVSYFYAEVQRTKALLDAAKARPGECLFLLDELMMGTNARERQIASREIVRQFLGAKASGAITTHDLSLTEWNGAVSARNAHFDDDVREGQMVFDYTLKPGVVVTTNALKLLEAAGVPMPKGE
jgi:ABC-type multidrug transport system fused ATPase/permease subunit